MARWVGLEALVLSMSKPLAVLMPILNALVLTTSNELAFVTSKVLALSTWMPWHCCRPVMNNNHCTVERIVDRANLGTCLLMCLRGADLFNVLDALFDARWHNTRCTRKRRYWSTGLPSMLCPWVCWMTCETSAETMLACSQTCHWRWYDGPRCVSTVVGGDDARWALMLVQWLLML